MHVGFWKIFWIVSSPPLPHAQSSGRGFCFCPAIVVGGDDAAPLQLFKKLLDGLLEKGYTKGSEGWGVPSWVPVLCSRTAAAGAVVHEEPPWRRWLLSFCSGQAGFRARQHLYKVCVVARQVCDFSPCKPSQHFMHLYVLGVPVDDTCDPWVLSIVWGFHHQPWSCRDQQGGSAWCPALCAGLCSEPALHAEEFILWDRVGYAVWICCYRW